MSSRPDGQRPTPDSPWASTPKYMRSVTLLRLGHAVLAEFDLTRTDPVVMVCYVTSEPELALTFHLRTRRGRARAGQVMIASDALHQQDLSVARAAVTHLLRMAATQGLPAVEETAPAPLLGVWRAHPADVDPEQRARGRTRPSLH